MKLNCSIAEDLLPLYLEEMCSEESRAALEEHLQGCTACREKLERMKSDGILPDAQPREGELRIPDYAKKVRRRRIRVGIAVTTLCLLAVCALSLLGLTLIDMYRTANPAIYALEDGVYNLTSAAFESTSEEVGEVIFYTNSTMIQVTVEGDGPFQGAVMLWDTQYDDSFIQIHEVEGERAICTFTAASAGRRYRITCDGLEGAAVTVSDGRTVSFWNSLRNILKELFRG